MCKYSYILSQQHIGYLPLDKAGHKSRMETKLENDAKYLQSAEEEFMVILHFSQSYRPGICFIYTYAYMLENNLTHIHENNVYVNIKLIIIMITSSWKDLEYSFLDRVTCNG